MQKIKSAKTLDVMGLEKVFLKKVKKVSKKY